jgi:dimethylhistidine N-methyltransferase
MTIHTDKRVLSRDFEPSKDDFREQVLAGLLRHPKTLPCKFFYDERGSQLFDEICELDEYYVTRTETRILRDNIAEIAEFCGRHCLLVELGSGNSSKTRLLLDFLESPVAYVPIDISGPHLSRAAETLNGDYFPLEILPVCADYNQRLTLPEPARTPEHTVIFFPGSTIGNFEPSQAATFLRRIAGWCEPGDGLLVGVDLQKQHGLLHRAYNDARGVTAAFNLNLLRRANAELGANFALEQFAHRAIYDEMHGRIEMHLVSLCKQIAVIARERIPFEQGEWITTEHSYKYQVETFRELCSAAGWETERTWTDENEWFGVFYLKREG